MRRERQAKVMALVNIPMRLILSLPFRTPLSASLMLAHLTGRRTGKSYQVPLSYVQDGETLLTPGGGRWKLNLRDGQPVRLRIAGRDRLYTPELIRDTDEVTRLLELMDSRGSRALVFSGIGRDTNGKIDRTKLEPAIAHGFLIVRWQPGSIPNQRY